MEIFPFSINTRWRARSTAGIQTCLLTHESDSRIIELFRNVVSLKYEEFLLVSSSVMFSAACVWNVEKLFDNTWKQKIFSFFFSQNFQLGIFNFLLVFLWWFLLRACMCRWFRVSVNFFFLIRKRRGTRKSFIFSHCYYRKKSLLLLYGIFYFTS